jgi:GTP-binding protein
LAKTSSTPGKTLSLNFYKFGSFYLVDTPGYGYAQQSKADRAKWVTLMEGYVSSNDLLKRVGIVIDARHEGLANDVTAMQWLDEMGLDWFAILTKSDKVTQSELARHEKYLRTGFGEGKSLFSVSSWNGKGIRALHGYLLSTFAAKTPASSAT